MASMGTTEVNSRVKVLENTALQPSPSLQQCFCSDVRAPWRLREGSLVRVHSGQPPGQEQGGELLSQAKSRVLKSVILQDLNFLSISGCKGCPAIAHRARLKRSSSLPIWGHLPFEGDGALEPAQQHFFSKHDNRTSFDKGIGRRKDLERLGQRHTFLRWAPCELELHQRPLESSYQSDFRSGPGLGVLPQRLVHFVQVRPARASTTYQQNFCQTSWGSRYSSDKVGPEAPVTSSLPDLLGPPRPKLLQHYLHAGVSECLNWSRALKKNG
ncbi:uncharacterized protein C3orf84 homolog [Elephas maximus indicus]|uniref:uncharacterized protein C3orf84 homolog n=1 Tax=Elephas maximus indicus TaxID=99487 RepID=UPI0021172A96|nr:uncharacterized protein C3orf84 homolog [Elephas maximus indicus]